MMAATINKNVSSALASRCNQAVMPSRLLIHVTAASEELINK